ncbi:hypothetical protein NKR23_g10067 [Pleurostoma richardsiae]|uniref:LysM domain-containing protein n=1 Tax=Pleurostoma richardsiae TaxID=41990 RepID=A0AA38R538_9PEZI|nr:hypothetical protein NKR23_g10067 [Pleurostoma richardsiae]
MSRFSHHDTDDERLPEGLERVGYDADTQTYSYRDIDGSYWEGVPGSRYGQLTRVSAASASIGAGPPSPVESSPERAPPSSWTESPRASAPLQGRRPSWRQELMPLLNFFLLLGLFLLAVFWYMFRTTDAIEAGCSQGAVPHVIVKDDTCWDIADGHHIDWKALLRENNWLNCGSLPVGETICVPLS